MITVIQAAHLAVEAIASHELSVVVLDIGLLGIDGFGVVPLAAAKLVARLKALVRRFNPSSTSHQLGGQRLDAVAHQASIHDQAIDLLAREWAVLEYLRQNALCVVSRKQIIDAVLGWSDDETLNAVEVYVSSIRSKIAGADISIKMIRGFG